MSDSPMSDLDDAPAFHPSDASQSSSSRATATLQSEDVVPHGCWVCASGTERPSMPPHSAVDIPAVGDHVPSITVDGLVQNATALEHETHVLRRRLELSTALNAGLAAHASVLHDRIDAQYDRAREGYDLGVALVARLYGEIDGLGGEETRLRERVQDLRALNAEDWEDRYHGLENSSYENACRLQDALTAAQARVAELTAQLDSSPALSAPTTDAPGVEAATQTTIISSSSATQTTVVSSMEAETQTEADLTESLRRDLAQARDELAVARTAHVPLQTDLRRVNALLVAHAEEHQRDVTRIRDLEETVSVAETARVTAQAKLAEAREEVQPLSDRADLFRTALLSAQLVAARRRQEDEALAVQLTAHLTASERTLAETRRESEARVARLEGIIDDSDRTYNDRTATWRRLLREARVGREIARRVRDALTSRLSTMVTSIGGTMDSAALVRSLEASMEAAVYAAVPLPPDLDPVTGQPSTSETTLSGASALASLWSSTRKSSTPPATPTTTTSSTTTSVAPTPVTSTPIVSSASSSAAKPVTTPSPSKPAWSLASSFTSTSAAMLTAASTTPATAASTPGATSVSTPPTPVPIVSSTSTTTTSASAESSVPGRPRTSGPGGPSLLRLAGTNSAVLRRSTRSSTIVDTAATDSALSTSIGGQAPDGDSLGLLGTRSRPIALPASEDDDSEIGPPPRQRRRISPLCSDPGSPSPGGGGTSSPPSATGDPWSDGGSDGDDPGDDDPPVGGNRPTPPPFFTPVIPPFRDRSDWPQDRYVPWPTTLRRGTLGSITAGDIRRLYLPPPGWIFPETAPPVPHAWNESLVTPQLVNDFYATRPWAYLVVRVQALTFNVSDAHFAIFLSRYDVHLEHWAQVYWEATHEFPVPLTATWNAWRRRRTSRRSHANEHLDSVMRFVVALFNARRADMDLLLDVIMLLFPRDGALWDAGTLGRNTRHRQMRWRTWTRANRGVDSSAHSPTRTATAP